MGQHIAYRLFLGLPVLFGVILFGFVLIKSTPGDPAMVIAGPMATPDVVEKIRVEMGLDQPTVVQFWRYLSRLAQGDLGRSMINNTSVAAELGSAVGATVELMVACMIFAVPIGIAIGTIAAVRRGSLIDRLIMAISVAGVSMPVFFVGLLLMQYIGYKWQLLPFLGRGGPFWTLEGLRPHRAAGDDARHRLRRAGRAHDARLGAGGAQRRPSSAPRAPRACASTPSSSAMRCATR